MKNLTRFDIALLFLFALVVIIVGSILVSQQGAKVSEILYTGLFIFSVQGIINLFLNRNLENYKNEISKETTKANHDLNLSIESFRSGLELSLNKQSKLYENRAAIISDLYGKIVDLHQKTSNMTLRFRVVPLDEKLADEQETNRIIATGDSYNDFIVYYLKNKIYLSPKTCEKIDEIQKLYNSVYYDYTLDKTLGIRSRETYETAFKTAETVNNVISPVLTQIESDFREFLGVN